MHITRNEDGFITLRPGNDEESNAMTDFFTGIPRNAVLTYGGRSEDPERPNSCRPHFKLGAREIVLSGTTEDDANEAFTIRDFCFWGSMHISVIGMEVDDQGLLITLYGAVPCNHCGKPCTSVLRAEWKTCSACVKKCEHQWTYGVVHGGGVQIGAGMFCRVCGIGKPSGAETVDESENVQAQEFQAAVDAGFIQAVAPLSL